MGNKLSHFLCMEVDMLKILIVGAGGFCGTVLRYLCGLLPISMDSGFPLKTLLVNILGSFAIGLISEFAVLKGPIHSYWPLFLQIGLCGGFTTFSAFSLETLRALENGKVLMGLAYISLSVMLCLLAVYLGKSLVPHLIQH